MKNEVISDEELKSRVLHKLARHRRWGGKHTSLDNLSKGFDTRHLGKEGYKRIIKVGEDLIREGLILWKPTHYGKEICLNPKMKLQIIQIIEKHIKLEKWEKDIYFR